MLIQSIGCTEQLAGASYEYYAEVTLHHSSPSGAYTRSTKGGLASTPSQVVQFAAIETCRLALQRGSHAHPPKSFLVPISAREWAYPLSFD